MDRFSAKKWCWVDASDSICDQLASLGRRNKPTGGGSDKPAVSQTVFKQHVSLKSRGWHVSCSITKRKTSRSVSLNAVS